MIHRHAPGNPDPEPDDRRAPGGHAAGPLIASLRQACFQSAPESWSFSRSWPHDDVRAGHLNVCSAVPGPQPIERGHHNHRPGGTSQVWRQGRDLEGRVEDQAGSLPHSNEVPSTRMQCRMTGSFRATATCAFFIPFRLAGPLMGPGSRIRWTNYRGAKQQALAPAQSRQNGHPVLRENGQAEIPRQGQSAGRQVSRRSILDCDNCHRVSYKLFPISFFMRVRYVSDLF